MLVHEEQQFINDAEVEVQHRRTSAWRVSLAHRHYTGSVTLDAQLSYQRGTAWFAALPAPEEYTGEDTARSRILRINASLNIPFTLYGQSLRFNTRYTGQKTSQPLTPPEQLSIGNRWTVRGFDGERTLSASNGSYWRNELGWQLPRTAQELYLAADYGSVSGYGSELLAGQHLAGMALGLRGQLTRYISYGVFIARPLSQPAGFSANKAVSGFEVSGEY